MFDRDPNLPGPDERENLDQAELFGIIARFLAARDRGENPDLEALLDEHPEHRPGIIDFLEREFIVALSMGFDTHLPARLGHYTLEKKLGFGGMGVVFHARDRRLNRDVALKLVLNVLVSPHKAQERFRREPLTIARLDHEHIVKVHDVGEVQGLPFYTMEILPGGTLSGRLEELSRDPRAAAALMVKVARAVQHAHDRGVLHRDLKPDNILFDAAGEPHVADFGLAKVVDEDSSLTRTEERIGAASYIPPEHARGSGASHTTRSDVYGLGLILYELLAGRKAFQGGSRDATLRLIAESDPVPPSRLRSGVPRELEVICLKCLEKEPNSRYPRAQAVAEDLENWLAGRPIGVIGPSMTYRVRKWARRRPALASGILLAVAAAILLSVYAVDEALETARQNLKLLELLSDVEMKKAQAERDWLRTLRLLHAEKIRLARAAADDLSFARACEELMKLMPRRGEPDFRGFEFFELARRFTENCGSLFYFFPTAHAVALSPDGRYIAAGGKEVALRRTADEQKDLLQHRHPVMGTVRCLAFSPRSDLVAIPSTETSLYLWSLPSLEHSVIETGHSLAAFAFGDGGGILATAGLDGTVRIFEVGGRKMIRTLLVPGGPARSMAFLDGDGTRIALGCEDGKVRAIDLSTEGEPVLLAEHSGPVNAIAVLEGRFLASASADGSLRLQDLRSPSEPLTLLEGAKPLHAVALSPDGALLAAGGEDRILRVWRLGEGGPPRALRPSRGHTKAVYSIAFSPDSRRIVSGGGGGVLYWDVAEIEDPEERPNPIPLEGPGDLAWDGIAAGAKSLYAVDEERALWRWRFERSPEGPRFGDAERLHRWDGVTGVILSPDARWAGVCPRAEAGELWRILEAPEGSVAVRKAYEVIQEGERLCGSGWSPDSRLLGIAYQGGTCTIHELDAAGERWRERLRLEPPRDERGSTADAEPDTITFSRDGRLAAATSRFESSFTLWSLDFRQGFSVRGDSYFTSAVFSQDGQFLITGDSNGIISFWEVSPILAGMWAPMHHGLFVVTDGAAITKLALVPDGRHLVSGSDDGTITIWDPIPGAWGFDCVERAVLRGGQDRVTSLTFLPGASALVAEVGALRMPSRAEVWKAVEPATTEAWWGYQRDILIHSASSFDRGETPR